MLVLWMPFEEPDIQVLIRLFHSGLSTPRFPAQCAVIDKLQPGAFPGNPNLVSLLDMCNKGQQPMLRKGLALIHRFACEPFRPEGSAHCFDRHVKALLTSAFVMLPTAQFWVSDVVRFNDSEADGTKA